jgi:two-component system, OmpR family, response regulator
LRILVVEDDAKLAGLIARGLREDGQAVDIAETGEDAVWMAGSTEYDVIVLDLMLPGIDGFEVCARMRADDVWTPILMLTARGAVEDRVAGLDGGADDYMVKPFEFAELRARLRSLARRPAVERPVTLEAGGLRLDPVERAVERDGEPIELSRLEFSLLEALMREPGRVMTRFDLLEKVWDSSYENRSNVVDVYIRYVRQKIDLSFGTDSIETVRGVGYRFRETSRDEG